jgi:hypothetical protein
MQLYSSADESKVHGSADQHWTIASQQGQCFAAPSLTENVEHIVCSLGACGSMCLGRGKKECYGVPIYSIAA